MYQQFHSTAPPDQGPPRLAKLSQHLTQNDLDGFIVPRADAHQGEYVAPRDDRLAWLTGFTGSAGFCAVLPDISGVFIDGRYREQVKDQVAEVFTPVHWPETSLGTWLKEQIKGPARIGFDPWLHAPQDIETLQRSLDATDISLVPVNNAIDAIWEDQPAPPRARAIAHPRALAGESHDSKRTRLADGLRQAGHSAAILALPDSIAWLLNIRGTDIPRNPVVHAFAILHADGQVDLFLDPVKLEDIADHLGDDIRVHVPERFLPMLCNLDGPVVVDKSSVPMAVVQTLETAGVPVVLKTDPCVLPKARKNATEVEGAIAAHVRDGAAMCEFLCWYDANAQSEISEIDLVTQLEQCRRDTGALRDISFETISGTGPNGAVIHYRVTHDTNRMLQDGDLVVLDSGGQYQDGTTDITRTLPVGAVGLEEKAAFTRVLQGMIAVSDLRWPKGLAGQHLEAIGRLPLWQAGQDFDHGLGHGVGSYLCVHEGPQRLSRLSDVPLEPGMILSNEPGYYRAGAFGIRIENLVVVQEAAPIPTQDGHRNMLTFLTLTLCPIDRRLIDSALLSRQEIHWLNHYHQTCRTVLGPHVSEDTQAWLDHATAPL